jgi:hypothetical protein
LGAGAEGSSPERRLHGGAVKWRGTDDGKPEERSRPLVKWSTSTVRLRRRSETRRRLQTAGRGSWHRRGRHAGGDPMVDAWTVGHRRQLRGRRAARVRGKAHGRGGLTGRWPGQPGDGGDLGGRAATAHGVSPLRGRSSWRVVARGGTPAQCGSEAHEGEFLGLESRRHRRRAEARGELRTAGGKARWRWRSSAMVRGNSGRRKYLFLTARG